MAGSIDADEALVVAEAVRAWPGSPRVMYAWALSEDGVWKHVHIVALAERGPGGLLLCPASRLAVERDDFTVVGINQALTDIQAAYTAGPYLEHLNDPRLQFRVIEFFERLAKGEQLYAIKSGDKSAAEEEAEDGHGQVQRLRA